MRTLKGQFPLLNEEGMLTVLVPAEAHDFRKDWGYPLTSVCHECGEWRMTSDLLYPEDLASNVMPERPSSRAGIVDIPRSDAPLERRTYERKRSTEFERKWRPTFLGDPNAEGEGVAFTYRNRDTGETNPNPPGKPNN